jgi:hypothetical protein
MRAWELFNDLRFRGVFAAISFTAYAKKRHHLISMMSWMLL